MDPSANAKRIALLWPSGHLDRCPPVLNLATALARRGYEVDIYSARNRWSPKPVMNEPGVRIIFLPGVQQQFNEPVARMTITFLRWVRPQIARGGYRAVLGVGIRGLMVAAELKRPGVRVGYHSLELYPPHEVRSIKERFFKSLERRAHAKTDFTLVQDAVRAKLLAEYNLVDVKSTTMLPVSPLGPAEVKRSTYLYEKLNIPREKKIVLYAGTLSAAFSAVPHLRQVAHLWPPEYVLVFHTNVVHEKLRPPRDDRFAYSTQGVPYAELGNLISSAYVALALYNARDDNMHYIGLSSGKMSEALRYGVPVIASDLPVMGDLVRETNCGVTVKDVAVVGDALELIEKDYSGYCARAVNCFNQKLAQELYIDGVIAALEG